MQASKELQVPLIVTLKRIPFSLCLIRHLLIHAMVFSQHSKWIAVDNMIGWKTKATVGITITNMTETIAADAYSMYGKCWKYSTSPCK